MNRTNIDFGVDLGTTNSEIAVFNGTSAEVVKNNENFEHTPSVVWINERGDVRVGAKAKDWHEFDPENSKIEFKRLMGQPERLEFEASGRTMSPEEASAEVLKQLKANVNEWKNEDITAAVITVPADFPGAATDATIRAARLAGFETSPLLQEPAAAASAYGFADQTQSTSTRWFIYDLGGGTFDAALVQNDEGLLKVEGCGGDSFLGGKNIDLAIVDDLLVPALLKQVPLRDFSRNNRLWRPAFARLKIHAEEAKISLSRRMVEAIDIRGLCKDDNGNSVDFFYELQRVEVERLTTPIIAKTIGICTAALAKRRLGPGDIEKLILVGGPTLMPCVRDHLKAELGIPLEFSIDPFTVVARGAAVFAAKQPLPVKRPKRAGEYQLEPDYKAIGPDIEPIISGRVLASTGQDFTGFTIQFINREARPPWRSSRIGLSPDGRFLATLWAEKGRKNIFSIELTDAAGTRQKIVPEELPYMVSGGVVDTQTLIHNTGVGLADNTVALLFKAGDPLPTRRILCSLQTHRHVRKGDSGDMIRIPFLEGNERKANRNEEFEAIEIPATNFKRDVPAGSEVQLTVWIDASRSCYARVYIPTLNEEFEEFKLERRKKAASADELTKQWEEEKKRLASLRAKVSDVDLPQARQLLQQIDSERLEHSVESALAAARSDQDAARTAASRLRDIQIALDRIDDDLRWPALVADAEGQIEAATAIVNNSGNASDKTQLASLSAAVRKAIEDHEEQALEIQSNELGSLAARIFLESTEGIVGRFYWLGQEENKAKMRDHAAAQRLIAQGTHAVQANNVAQLRLINNQLAELLPIQDREPAFDRSSVLLLNAYHR